MRLVFSRACREWDSLDWVGFLTLPTLLIARFFPFDKLKISWCNFKNLTGWPCPTCNMTTSFVHLTHGRLRDAVLVSPLGSILFVFCVLALILFVCGRIIGLPAPRAVLSRRERTILWLSLAAAVLVNWAYIILFPRH